MKAVDLALTWAERGAYVFPLSEDKMPLANCRTCVDDPHHDKASCPCHQRGIPCHGFHAASRDPKVIEKLFSSYRARNVGLDCGRSGLIVIDCDTHKEDKDTKITWEEDGNALVTTKLIPQQRTAFPREYAQKIVHGIDTYKAVLTHRRIRHVPTFTVKTPSGGVHFLYKAPRSDLSTAIRAYHLIDVKTTGGYVVAAGSITTRGVYRAVHSQWPPAPAPAWLTEDLIRRQGTRGTYANIDPDVTVELEVGDPDKYRAAVLRNCVQEIRRAKHGHVYETIRGVAYKLAPLVNGGVLDDEIVASAMEIAVMEIPCPERVNDVRRCLDSARGVRHALRLVRSDFAAYAESLDLSQFTAEFEADPEIMAMLLSEEAQAARFDPATTYQRVIRLVEGAQNQPVAIVHGVAILAPLVDSGAIEARTLVDHLTQVSRSLTKEKVVDLASQGFQKWRHRK